MFYTSTFKFSFYFPLKINSFRCLCLGSLLDFIYNKSKLKILWFYTISWPQVFSIRGMILLNKCPFTVSGWLP